MSAATTATQSLIQASSGSIYNRALVNMPKLDFAPRIGLAYSLDPKTVVRAGYGLSYAQFNREGGENLLVYNLPNIVNTNLTQVPQYALPSQTGTAKLLTLCTDAQVSATYDSSNPTPCFRTSAQGYPTGMTSVPTNPTDLAARNRNTQAR
jgi:hypothetical protein